MLEEAVEGLQTALAAQPDDGFVLTFLGQVKTFQGKYEEAEQYFKRADTLDPASLWANLFSPSVPLYGSNPEPAVEMIKTAQHFFPGDALLTSWEALLWAKRGNFRRAEQFIEKALKVRKSVLHTHHMWHTAAAAYATVGKPELAVALLSRAAKTGLPNYPVFRDDPHFQSMHKYGPYLRLLATIKKETEGYRQEFGSS